MIVPSHWAEGRAQHQDGRRTKTVRRYGWSDLSPADAQRHADERAQAALAQLLRGETVRRLDHKRAYNGAEGLPIREQVVSRQGETVITRNAYGARCLNTPDVLFVDIDFPETVPAERGARLLTVAGVLVLAAVIGGLTHSFRWGLGVAALGLWWHQSLARPLARWQARRAPAADPQAQALAKVQAFTTAHPGWRWRVYRTPAGLRLLAMQRRFDANDPALAAVFDALGADPIYVRMCRNQACFRARVSAKPWRIGLRDRLPGHWATWPVSPRYQLAREAWIADYERRASAFAACTLLAELGDAPEDPAVREVQQLHDALCHVDEALPLA